MLSLSLLIAVFEGCFILVAIAQSFLEWALDIPPPVIVGGVWCLWTLWHSYLFPKHRISYLCNYSNPYRIAFVRDIFPGVVVGFSQMWRPLINGNLLQRVISPGELFLINGHPLRLACVLSLASVGLAVMISAIRTIGLGNAAFLAEFRTPSHFTPIEKGVYGVFANPLFWSGILFSCALAILAPTKTSLMVAAVNILYGTIYSRLEKRRLNRIFGHNYTLYTARLPSFRLLFRGGKRIINRIRR